jgi:hypothetical protein
MKPTTEPSQPSVRRRLRRLGLGAAAVLACAVAVVGGLLRHEPAFYRSRIAAALDGEPPPEKVQQGRRLVTKLSALRADFLRPGPWEAVITEAEVNAWLATELPRNHPGLLPAGCSAPRVAIGPRRVRAGVRVGGATLGSVASLDLEVVLREVNQLGIVVTAARLGALPLPRGPATHELARRIQALGMPTELRRPDGRPVIMVYISSTPAGGGTSHRLESLALEAGTLLVAGVTRDAAPRSEPR